jgi:hypothetical protein
MRVKKGSQAQIMEETSLKDGREVVKIKVEGIMYRNGKVRTGVWVPVVFVEKEVEGNGDGDGRWLGEAGDGEANGSVETKQTDNLVGR